MRRVGIISLLHESNTFLPGTTTFEDFERDHVLTGPAISEFFAGGHHEVSGYLEGLRAKSLEIVPLFAARAVPSGTIEARTADRLLAMMLDALREAGPIDGLLVALHGAAVAENHRDLDGHCLTLLRETLGPGFPIIGTLDLHANVSPAMVKAADALIAYRTNPHGDQRARGWKRPRSWPGRFAGRSGPPVQAAALPPIVIGIEAQRTAKPPANWLCEAADRLRTRSGLLSVSVVLGFAYADVAEMGSGFIAVADGDPTLAQQAVDELATGLWERRADFNVRGLTIDEALRQVEQGRGKGPIGLLDIGDNVGGGSPGDGTLLAHALQARRCRAFACLWDPAASATAAGVSGRCRLRMGGKTAAQPSGPLECEVTVKRLHHGRFTEPQARHGGMTDFNMGPTAVVQTDAGLTVMLTTNRVMPVSLGQLTCCDIEPAVFDAIVLKGVHAPAEAYEPVCTRLIQVDTPGPTTGNLNAFEYQHRRRPLYPFQKDWAPPGGE